MTRMKSNRRGTSIRLDEENDAWLDKEAARTGKSRSDLLNKAIADARDWRPKVEQAHRDRKKEHDRQIELLEEIKNLIKNHNDITKP